MKAKVLNFIGYLASLFVVSTGVYAATNLSGTIPYQWFKRINRGNSAADAFDGAFYQQDNMTKSENTDDGCSAGYVQSTGNFDATYFDVNATEHTYACEPIDYQVILSSWGSFVVSDSNFSFSSVYNVYVRWLNVETAEFTLPTPTKDGWTFYGWCDDSALTINCSTNRTFNPSSHAPSDSADSVAFYAKWKVHCDAGTYLPANGSACLPCPAVSSGAGHWCPGGDFDPSSSDQGLNSCPPGYPWSEQGNTEIESCYITMKFYPGQGATFRNVTYTTDDSYVALPDKYKQATDWFTPISGTDGSKNINSALLAPNGAAIPTKPGYIFDGWLWQKSDGTVSQADCAAGNLQLYTDDCGVATCNYRGCTPNTPGTCPPNFTYGGGVCVPNSKMYGLIDANTVISSGSQRNFYAKWAPGIYGFTLSANAADAITTGMTTTIYEKMDGGWYLDDDAETAISSTNLITAPTRTGYTFDGYYTCDGTDPTDGFNASGCEQIITSDRTVAQNASTNIVGGGTLYAKWTLNVYTVTYKKSLNDANPYITTAPEHVGEDILNPTETGKIFAGWCLSDYYNNGVCTDGVEDKRVITTENHPATSSTRKIFNTTVPNVTADTTYIALWEDNKFQIDITDIDVTSANIDDKYFAFRLSVQGTFFIDWGDGIVEYIDKADIYYKSYSHTYSENGDYTIGFGGNMTNFTLNATNPWPSISFCASVIEISSNEGVSVDFADTRSKLKNLRGSLGQLFGITTAEDYMFSGTFSGCPNLTTIENDLFSGITTAGNYAFLNTFNGCTNLTTIPDDLFSDITTTGNNAFISMFSNSGLTTIPNGLFSNITTAGTSAFRATFANCSNLTTIGNNLFSGLTTAAGDAFYRTFAGCSSLTAVPDNIFKNVKTAQTYAFSLTFDGCTSLTTVPGDLFKKVETAETRAFGNTFSGCTKLTTIGDNLFSHITTAGNYAFGNTFDGCTKLTTIGDNLFNGLTTAANYAFYNTFANCKELTTVPSNLFNNITTAGIYAFWSTFDGCTKLTTIDGLFSNIETAGNYAFSMTFNGCTGLTTIPDGLFGKIENTATGMFWAAFKGCTGLTQLPDTLFKSRETKVAPAANMFKEMFSGCSGLNGYVPTTLFAPYDATGYDGSTGTAMDDIFKGDTNLSTSCNTTGWQEAQTAFRSDWCIESDSNTCGDYANESDRNAHYAISCELADYTITYDCDDDGGHTTSTTLTFGDTFILSGAESCSKTGHRFNEWLCTYDDANHTSLADGDTYNQPYSATCVAQWNANMISLSWNNGPNTATTTADGSNSCKFGEHAGTEYGITVQQASRPGYTFNGWYITP